MANAVAFDYYPDLAGTFELPANRGVFSSTGLILFQRQSLPTDPIGIFALTLNNIVTGSSLQIESQDSSTVFHNSVVTGTTKSVALQVYASGSPLNALRIKVRKGSVEPFYQPYETLLPAAVGAQSIYVSQIPD